MCSSSSGAGASVRVGQAGGREHREVLIAEAGSRKEVEELAPVAGLLADLLDELALGEIEQRLVGTVALARRDLERVLQT